MLEAKGEVHISYSVDCPHCGETQYSDINASGERYWDELEYGDGLPYGELKCCDCKEIFHVEIKG